MKYKVGDKVIESNYNRGIIKEIEHQSDDCFILGIDWGDGNIVWAAPTWVEPDYRALYEQEKALREALVDEIINYITNESEIPIPVNRFFHSDGTHITQKEYGIILLEILCDELRNKFKPTTNN